MNSKNNIVKEELLSLYKKGRSVSEAHEEISKSHSSYKVSLKSVKKWFETFKSQVSISDDYNVTEQENKLTDEQLINLVRDNPKLDMKELAKLTGISHVAISRKLKQINIGENSTNHAQKTRQKFIDEYLIDLVNKNPDLSMVDLAKIAGTSAVTISNRIRQINSSGERVRYTKKTHQLNGSEVYLKNPLIEDEYLIKLINNNPGLSMEKIAALTNSSQQTISRRINQINKYSKRVDYQRKNGKKLTNEFLIHLVNEDSDFNQEELATLTNVKQFTISDRLSEINDSDVSINYRKKRKTKFTDAYLINLIKENPDFNMTELAKLAGVTSITISRRIKQINTNGVKADYTSETVQKDMAELTSKSKLTDEYLINLINENPELNMAKLAAIAGTTQKTISTRIKKINSNGEKVKYTRKKGSKK